MKYISGGYYIVSHVELPSSMGATVLPDKLLSISQCICDHHPDMSTIWSRSKKGKQEYANQLKLDSFTYQALEEWTDAKFEEGTLSFLQTFVTLEAAKEFYSTFMSKLENIYILGIGLPLSEVEDFLEYEESLLKPEVNRFEMEKLLIAQKEIDMVQGQPLGYEIIGFEDGAFHSYLCNGLERDFKEHFSFRLNEHGFIPSLEEAKKYCEYSNKEDLGTEPVLWQPWLITKYIT